MFDTNIFDAILDGKIDINQFPNKFSYFVTHVQKDEIEAIRQPEKLKRKEQLLKLFKEIKKEEIVTEGCVVGASKVGKAKIGNGGILEKLRKGNLKHTEDALIGETAIKNNLILVTNDDKLRKKSKSLGGQAITFLQFLSGDTT